MLAITRVGPSKPVVWLVATILAPTTAAPEGSTMVPRNRRRCLLAQRLASPEV